MLPIHRNEVANVDCVALSFVALPFSLNESVKSGLHSLQPHGRTLLVPLLGSRYPNLSNFGL